MNIIDTLFNAQYSNTTWLSQYQNVKPFWILLQQEITELAMVSAGTGKLQSDHHHQHTDAEYNKGDSNLFMQTSIHWSFESSILANIE